MDNMEFVMGTSLEALPKTIDFNFIELKAELGQRLEYYNGLVVTEDDIKSAKGDRASLNSLRDALENKRKEVKKDCMAPYTDFEVKVKELVGLIDKPIAAIDGQLKVYEDKRREAKRAEIKAIYEETIGELRNILSFDKLWHDEWYNTSVSLKKIRTAITDAEEKVSSDLAVLSTVESEFAEAVKVKYLESLDLNAALREQARMRERTEQLRAYEEKRAADAAQAKAAQNAADISNAPEDQRVDASTRGAEQSQPAGTWEVGGCAAVEETIYLLRFECQLTKNQAASLSKFLKDSGISYRRIQ